MATVNANTPKTKVCADCKQVTPIYLFETNAAKKSGLGSYCLACRRKRNNASYKVKFPNTLKKKQLYSDSAEALGLRWCSGYNPAAPASAGHYTAASGFGANPFKCFKCISVKNKYHYAKRKQARQLKAVQE